MGSRYSKKSYLIQNWLDDESKRHGAPPKRKAIKVKSSKWISWDDSNATVVEVYPSLCKVRCDNDHSEVLCQYQRKKLFMDSTALRKERSPVTVGDRVLIKKIGSKDAIVQGVSKRRNLFERRAPGKLDQIKVHPIAANLDLLVVMASVERPKVNLPMIQKMIESAKSRSIKVLVVFNKMDLHKGESKPWEEIESKGVDVLLMSAKDQFGVDAFKNKVSGLKVAFCGQSGVGKTTLMRQILDESVGKVGAVSDYHDEGKHTTSSSVMYFYNHDSAWVDTPGIRDFVPVEQVL